VRSCTVAFTNQLIYWTVASERGPYLAEPGYVYVLFNPSLKGLVKIGRTGRDPRGRAAELSGTALPTPFEVVYDAYFNDSHAVEQFVHATLTNAGFRAASNREFFEVSLRDAVKAVIAAEAHFPTASPPRASDESPGASSGEGPDDICDFADDLYFGRGDVLEDEERAIDLYRKAAAAGSMRGVLGLARAWYYRESAVSWPELRRALERAIDDGVIEAHAYMAIGMIRANHSSNARKAWNRLFENFPLLPIDCRVTWGARFIRFTDVEIVFAPHREALNSDREAILAYIDQHEAELKVRALQLFGGFEALPGVRGEVIALGADDLMIRFGKSAVRADLRTVKDGAKLRIGQYVEVVSDPATHRIRFIRPQ
jgi:hypothetical protein